MVHQFYQTRVIDEFVLRGNAATLKCLVPSFVSDFVQVVEWVADDGSSFAPSRADDGYGNARVKPAAPRGLTWPPCSVRSRVSAPHPASRAQGRATLRSLRLYPPPDCRPAGPSWLLQW